MDLNVISSRRGWFLSKITGSLDLSKKIVLSNFQSIRQHHLTPGTFVLIKNINKPKYQDKFILLPSFETTKELYQFLEYLVKEFGSCEKFHKVDENYLDFIRNLMKSLSEYNRKHEKVKFCDLELHKKSKSQHGKGINIGLPDFWLTKNDLFVGETVLLRADFPSPIIA
jgi:hypothetical protein